MGVAAGGEDVGGRAVGGGGVARWPRSWRAPTAWAAGSGVAAGGGLALAALGAPATELFALVAQLLESGVVDHGALLAELRLLRRRLGARLLWSTRRGPHRVRRGRIYKADVRTSVVAKVRVALLPKRGRHATFAAGARVGVGRRRDEERAAQIASTACGGARRPRGRRPTAARRCWLQLGAPARWYLISLTPRACDGRGSVGRSLGVRTAGPPERRRRRRPRRRRGQFQTQAPTWG